MNLPPSLIQSLAFLSLFTLLLSIGLSLSLRELMTSLRQIRLLPILLINFILIPLLGVFILQVLDADSQTSRALLLLAAAPFAPVVPLFVRMSRGPLSLAAGLTGIMPFFSCVLTPAALTFAFWLINDMDPIKASPSHLFGSLFLSITTPLVSGLLLRSRFPDMSRALQKPVEWLAEAVGVLSLVTLFLMESSSLKLLSPDPVVAAVLLSELAFLAGFILYPGPFPARLTLAFGTSSRNIGLSLFLAVSTQHDLSLLAALLAESLTLIGLGLIHTVLMRGLARALRSH